jgi:hypothetical protein
MMGIAMSETKRDTLTGLRVDVDWQNDGNGRSLPANRWKQVGRGRWVESRDEAQQGLAEAIEFNTRTENE